MTKAKETKEPKAEKAKTEEKKVETPEVPETPEKETKNEEKEIAPGVIAEEITDPKVIKETLEDPEFREAIVILSNATIGDIDLDINEKFQIGSSTKLPLKKVFETEDGKNSFQAIFKSDTTVNGNGTKVYNYLIQPVELYSQFINKELFEIGNFFYFKKEEEDK